MSDENPLAIDSDILRNIAIVKNRCQTETGSRIEAIRFASLETAFGIWGRKVEHDTQHRQHDDGDADRGRPTVARIRVLHHHRGRRPVRRAIHGRHHAEARMNDEERAVIVEVLCSQALADNIGDVRDAERKLWGLLGIVPSCDDSDADWDDPFGETRDRLAKYDIPLPAYLRDES